MRAPVNDGILHITFEIYKVDVSAKKECMASLLSKKITWLPYILVGCEWGGLKWHEDV